MVPPFSGDKPFRTKMDQDLKATLSRIAEALDRLAPRDVPYVHGIEGPDDMPAHIKMALTRTSETIPFADGRLLLGTWQGIFLWEHRRAPHTRHLVLTFLA